jgi:polyhydroxyalkanoate synthesis regulator phasin
MAQDDLFKRYLDAGLAFTTLNQARAEALVKDLVRAGEVQADQAREAVADLLERSRKNSERLLATVRQEVRSQITSLGLASQADLDRMEERVQGLVGSLTGRPTAPADPARPPEQAATQKATKKKATGKKTTSGKKKATGKKTTSGKKKAAATKSAKKA